MSKNFWSASELETGEYTPTITHDTNIAASTPNQCMYTRIGDIVTVSGSVSITATVNGAINFNMTLPIASNLTSYIQAAGSGRSYTNVPGDTIAINGDATNDEVDCIGNANSTAAQIYMFTYQYQIV